MNLEKTGLKMPTETETLALPHASDSAAVTNSLPHNDNMVALYLEYIRKLYDRISEREQHTGITRWAILAGLAYIAWQSVPLLAKMKEAELGWTYLSLHSAYLSIFSLFTHYLYQVLSASRHSSPFEYRQVNNSGNHATHLGFLIIFISSFPSIFLSYLAWSTFPGLTDLNYRFLNLTTWTLSAMIVVLAGALLYVSRYMKNNGFMPPILFAGSNAQPGRLIHISVPILFITSSLYYFASSLNNIPTKIFEPVLLLSGSIALIGPCIEVILSGIRRQERLNMLSILERDILMHNLSAAQIKTRLEDELIGCELGDWAKRRVEQVRAAHVSLMEHCKEAENVLLQVSELDSSLKFERMGRIKHCTTQLDMQLDELIGFWEPLHDWLTSCKNQPFLDPYIANVVKDTLSDLSPLMQISVKTARHTLGLLKKPCG